MRCARCAAEVPAEAVFCGLCGARRPPEKETRKLVSSSASSSSASSQVQPASSLSLFELPVDRSAKWARVVAVLVLDAILASSGVAMGMSYLRQRGEHRAREASPGATDEASVLAPVVEVPPPRIVRRRSGRRGGGPGASLVPGTPTEPQGTGAAGVPAPEATAPSSPLSNVDAAAQPPVPAIPREPGAEAEPPLPPTEENRDVNRPVPPTEFVPPPLQPSGPAASTHGDAGSGKVDEGPAEQAIEFSAEAVRKVVTSHTTQIKRCAERAAKASTKSEPLRGKLEVQFAVLPSGVASDVHVIQNSTGSEVLGTCVVKLMESWKFPSPGEEAFEFVWPFVFSTPR
jgi:TonB family protein